ncbi:PbsX family transcriptional regulator, partial [Salmonella enterica subsp. enterica serovar Infantis]|nr:PbsX family transcriptional regulator [Salmonella enterica subsp. enterica serovar Infantis]
GMTIDNGCLIIEPQKRPRYSLEELLAQCDPHAEMSDEDREWMDAPAVGKEIL